MNPSTDRPNQDNPVWLDRETPDKQTTTWGLLAECTGMIRVNEQRCNFRNSACMRLIPLASGTAVCSEKLSDSLCQEFGAIEKASRR